MSTTPQSTTQQPVSFPQVVELTIKLKFEASDHESFDYIKPNPDGSVQVGVIADLFDILADNGTVTLLEINGKSYSQVKKEMAALMP